MVVSSCSVSLTASVASEEEEEEVVVESWKYVLKKSSHSVVKVTMDGLTSYATSSSLTSGPDPAEGAFSPFLVASGERDVTSLGSG